MTFPFYRGAKPRKACSHLPSLLPQKNVSMALGGQAAHEGLPEPTPKLESVHLPTVPNPQGAGGGTARTRPWAGGGETSGPAPRVAPQGRCDADARKLGSSAAPGKWSGKIWVEKSRTAGTHTAPASQWVGLRSWETTEMGSGGSTEEGLKDVKWSQGDGHRETVTAQHRLLCCLPIMVF